MASLYEEFSMNESRRTKPIDFIKSDTAAVMAEVSASGEPLYLVDGGEPRLVLLDVEEFARMEEQLALLKLLAQGREEIAQGRFRDAESVFAELDREDQQ
jgi:PHD/YefM family antitoxin component YafN of YafNO toxin-antitoxin module